jgi:hypothetical protein
MMRLMTGVAGYASGVIRRDHLREVLRLGSVGLVTTGAYDGCVQLRGLHRTRVIRMLSLGPVASLTSDHYMLAKSFLIDDVGVAAFAGLVPGKRNRPGRDLADCGPSIVSILPKTAGHNRCPQDHEGYQGDYDDDCQPNEVFDVLKQNRVPCAILPGAICVKIPQCSLISEILPWSDDGSHRKL